MHAEHFDKRFSYVDGTPGDDGKPEKADQEGTSTRISEWKPKTYMDKAKTHEFQEFKMAKPGAYPGSIDYSEVEANPGHMARTIAWEVWHRDKAERALKKMRDKHEHAASAIVNTSKKNGGRGIDKSTLLAKVVELITNHDGHKNTPREKTKKTRKLTKINPDEAAQREIFDKSQRAQEERYRNRKDGKKFMPKDFFPRTPGTYGPQQKKEPY